MLYKNGILKLIKIEGGQSIEENFCYNIYTLSTNFAVVKLSSSG